MSIWKQFIPYTQARIGLDRSGHSISTKDLLAFQFAHAQAHDAVHDHWSSGEMLKRLKAMHEKPFLSQTEAKDREHYLKYPHLGGILQKGSYEALKKQGMRKEVDVAFIVTDGLSSKAINHHFLPFWKVFKPMLQTHLGKLNYRIVIAPYGRVALSDDIGKALGAAMSIIFVGERPGLSASDSMGIYLTYAPKRSNSNANRNCISNIHPPEGLSYAIGAEKLLYLMSESFRRQLSGVHLKEEMPLVEFRRQVEH